MAPPSDAALVRYLLGTADPADEERFDELSVTDAAFAERLRAIEHDLADAYARGELSPSDRERWAARYLTSQRGLDDLALAETLAARERREMRAPRRSWIPWSLAAAAVLILAAITGYRATRQPPAPLQTVARQQGGAPTPTAAPAPAQIVALTLMPSVRSIDEPPTLTIPGGTTDVRLTLRLDNDDSARYVVALRDLMSNAIVWRSTETAAEGSGANRSVVVSVPAATFQARRYLISVSAGPPDVRETVATYPLAVVLQ